jgi:hypothetical protein
MELLILAYRCRACSKDASRDVIYLINSILHEYYKFLIITKLNEKYVSGNDKRHFNYKNKHQIKNSINKCNNSINNDVIVYISINVVVFGFIIVANIFRINYVFIAKI